MTNLSIFLSLTLSLQVFSQPNNSCPRLNGEYRSCQLVTKAIDMDQEDVFVPTKLFIGETFIRGEVTYVVNDEPIDFSKPFRSDEVIDLIQPFSPPKVRRTNSGESIVNSRCLQGRLEHTVVTRAQNPKDTPLNMISILGPTRSGDLLVEMFAPRNLRDLGDAERWPFIYSFKCEK